MTAAAFISGSAGLVHCFEPCLVRVLGILDSREAEADPAAVRAGISALLDDAALAMLGRYSTDAVPLARRFVAAWADERLSSDDWPGRDAWRAHPLQSDWGEGRAAGEWFFDAVARLRPDRAGDGDLAALALRCLSLGFDGRLHYTPREIADLRRTLVLRFGFAQAPCPFPPPVAAGYAALPRGGGLFRFGRWLAPLAAAAVLFGAYVLADRSLDLYLHWNR